MLEKEPSGASPDNTQALHPAGAAPGGPFPQIEPPLGAVLNPPAPQHQYSLHFLIAVIKKSSTRSASNNTEKPQ